MLVFRLENGKYCVLVGDLYFGLRKLWIIMVFIKIDIWRFFQRFIVVCGFYGTDCYYKNLGLTTKFNIN
jgi:hypothetical protein